MFAFKTLDDTSNNFIYCLSSYYKLSNVRSTYKYCLIQLSQKSIK